MKGITDLEKIGAVKPQSKQTPGTGTDGDLFKKTFEKALNESGSTGQAQGTPVSAPLGEIQSPMFNLDASASGGLETGTESLLNKLDTYIEALSNPGQTLKDIEPLLLDIKNEADQLSETLLGSSEDQKALKSIAEQSTLLAQVEYQKFVRGDYS